MIDQESRERHRNDVPIPDDLVPIHDVIVEMSDPDGGYVSMIARDYYYLHYATDEQREKMDRDDRRWRLAGWTGCVFVVGLLVFAILSQFIK